MCPGRGNAAPCIFLGGIFLPSRCLFLLLLLLLLLSVLFLLLSVAIAVAVAIAAAIATATLLHSCRRPDLRSKAQ